MILLLKDILENILESAVVSFQDGVLGAHVERPFLLDGVLEAAVSEAGDGLSDKDGQTDGHVSRKNRCSTFTIASSAVIQKLAA